MLVIKNLLASPGDKRDMDSIPELGRSPGGGYGNPLQYSCLENPMDRGAWQATAHGVAKSKAIAYIEEQNTRKIFVTFS